MSLLTFPGPGVVFKPEHFSIHELVPPDLYDKYVTKLNKESYLWGLFDKYVLWSADQLRKKYGSTIVNNWKSGGGAKASGFRHENDGTGAGLSQHKVGRALDLKFTRADPQDIIRYMVSLGLHVSGDWRTNPDPRYDPFRYITTVERTFGGGKPCTWLHIDTRMYTSGNGALIILDL